MYVPYTLLDALHVFLAFRACIFLASLRFNVSTSDQLIKSNIVLKIKTCVISDNGSQNQGHMDGGHLMSACKEACRRAFNSRHPRLVTPMYSCSVLVNSDVLGKFDFVFI